VIFEAYHPVLFYGSTIVGASAPISSTSKGKLDFFFQIDDYIKSKEKKVSPGMFSIYKNLKDHLLAYQQHSGKKITFDSFDYNFYEGLVDFLTYIYVLKGKMKGQVGLRRSSIGKTVKQLRTFLRDRIRRKIIPAIDLSEFKIIDEETDAIYLNTREIRRVYELDLSRCPHLVRFRDIFVLGCLTGLRFSDFSNIRPEDIRKGML
jgi:hypothetical protein